MCLWDTLKTTAESVYHFVGLDLLSSSQPKATVVNKPERPSPTPIIFLIFQIVHFRLLPKPQARFPFSCPRKTAPCYVLCWHVPKRPPVQVSVRVLSFSSSSLVFSFLLRGASTTALSVPPKSRFSFFRVSLRVRLDSVILLVLQ